MHKYILIVLLTITHTLMAVAKPNIIGNGGHGVKNGESYFLLDLAELNIETKPYFGSQKLVDQRISFALNHKVSPNVISLVQRKVYDILKIDRILAESVIVSLYNLEWLISPRSLNFIPVDTTIPKDKLLQVAIRVKNSVLIDQNAWVNFNDAHKAALIIHEAIYTIAKKPINKPEKNLSLIRNLTGYLFSENLARIQRNDFQKKYSSIFLTEKDFPISFSAYEKMGATTFRQMVFNPLLITNDGSIFHLSKSNKSDLFSELCLNQNNLTQAYVILTTFKQRFEEEENHSDETLGTEVTYSSKIPTLHKSDFISCNNFVDEIFNKSNQAYPGLVDATSVKSEL